jgi:hypothetical protein
MEKKRLAGNPITIAGITLILVTRSSINCQPSGSNIFFFGLKQPVNIVVASQSAKRAFDINGREIPLDKLIQEVPSLDEVLKIA